MFKFETPKKSLIPWNFLPTTLTALRSSETRKNDHYQLIPVPLKKVDGTPHETTKIAFEGLSSLKVLQGKIAALDPDADYFLSPLCKSAQESVLSTSKNLKNTEGRRAEDAQEVYKAQSTAFNLDLISAAFGRRGFRLSRKALCQRHPKLRRWTDSLKACVVKTPNLCDNLCKFNGTAPYKGV